jgi:6-phosphogluconolactonase
VPELVVAEDLAAAAVGVFLETRPRLVSLAGGRTPERFYLALSETEYPWGEVELVMGDERCVESGHPDSNAAMVERSLVARVQPEAFHVLPGERCDPEEADRRIREALGGRRLDLAVLGLGEDGHTASLFPGDGALEERERFVVRVDRPDHPRLTLTLPVLSSAQVALFLVAGEEKRVALQGLLAGDDVPAARVRADRVIVLADQAAAPVDR